MKKIERQLVRYWAAMNATAVDAGVHAVAAFFGVAGAHAISSSVAALTLQQFAAVFLVAYGRAILGFLEGHPLAELVENLAGAARTGSGERSAGGDRLGNGHPLPASTGAAAAEGKAL